MNRLTKWLAFALVITAAAGVTCAPVDTSPTEPVRSPISTASAPGETVPQPARPARVQDRVELAIEQAKKRDLLTTNGFWTVFHGILGLGPSITLLNPDTGQRVNALEYVCNGGAVRGMQFVPTQDGLDVNTGPMFVGQGHQDQFVAEMAQWGMTPERKFLVNGKEYTFRDFIRHTQMRARVNAGQELSWAVLIIGQYLGTDLSWINRAGEKLHFDDLVRYELDQPIETAACGGTHRLFGLTWVYHLHLRKGGKATGVWQDVAAKQLAYQQLAKAQQNGDGSFSTNFFRGPGNADDRQLRMNTTGHIFEWLALSLPDAELRAAWMQNAANNLALQFLEIQGQPMEGGTLYHAVHGLLIYYARVYDRAKLGPLDPPVPLP